MVKCFSWHIEIEKNIQKWNEKPQHKKESLGVSNNNRYSIERDFYSVSLFAWSFLFLLFFFSYSSWNMIWYDMIRSWSPYVYLYILNHICISQAKKRIYKKEDRIDWWQHLNWREAKKYIYFLIINPLLSTNTIVLPLVNVFSLNIMYAVFYFFLIYLFFFLFGVVRMGVSSVSGYTKLLPMKCGHTNEVIVNIFFCACTVDTHQYFGAWANS